MEQLPFAKSYRELIVYQKTRGLAHEIFQVSQSFPGSEHSALIDQIRRSSRSIGAQIAEAWARRRYERYFVSKLTDADGERLETEHWLIVSMDCGYLPKSEVQRLGELCREIGRMLSAMIESPERFCSSPRIQEDPGYDEDLLTDNCLLFT